MKLSFSLPSKPSSSSSSKPAKLNDSAKNDAPPSKHFVTEFDASKPPTHHTQPAVIPPIQNEWRPTKKMKNLALPITDPNSTDQSLQFEQDTTATADPGADMSYGLNLRSKNDTSGSGDANLNNIEGVGDRDRRLPAEDALLKRFKEDLKRLPEDRGLDEFEDVPVEGFAKALLAGYGWSEGMGIGRNAKEDVKVVQYSRRTAKEGLGFVGDGPGAGRSDHKTTVKSKEQNGRRGDGGEGKIVRIVGGRDAGLKGSVLRRIGEDWIIVKVSRKSGEEVEVRVSVDDVAELGSAEEERCLRKLKELRMEPDDREKDRGRKSDRGSSRSKRERGQGRNEEPKRMDVDEDQRKDEQTCRKQGSWLASHIRVRIISRDFKGGRLYLKKGHVLDVVGPTTCDIAMDESKEIVQGVSQDLLETALPRRGGPVLVLSGKYKGTFGSLVERDLDQEIGIVKDSDTHEMLNVRLDQIAEYIGDSSLLGY